MAKIYSKKCQHAHVQLRSDKLAQVGCVTNDLMPVDCLINHAEIVLNFFVIVGLPAQYVKEKG